MAPSRLQAVGFSLTGQSDLHIRNFVERANIDAVHVHDVIDAPHVETAVFGEVGRAIAPDCSASVIAATRQAHLEMLGVRL